MDKYHNLCKGYLEKIRPLLVNRPDVKDEFVELEKMCGTTDILVASTALSKGKALYKKVYHSNPTKIEVVYVESDCIGLRNKNQELLNKIEELDVELSTTIASDLAELTTASNLNAAQKVKNAEMSANLETLTGELAEAKSDIQENIAKLTAATKAAATTETATDDQFTKLNKELGEKTKKVGELEGISDRLKNQITEQTKEINTQKNLVNQTTDNNKVLIQTNDELNKKLIKHTTLLEQFNKIGKFAISINNDNQTTVSQINKLTDLVNSGSDNETHDVVNNYKAIFQTKNDQIKKLATELKNAKKKLISQIDTTAIELMSKNNDVSDNLKNNKMREQARIIIKLRNILNDKRKELIMHKNYIDTEKKKLRTLLLSSRQTKRGDNRPITEKMANGIKKLLEEKPMSLEKKKLIEARRNARRNARQSIVSDSGDGSDILLIANNVKNKIEYDTHAFVLDSDDELVDIDFGTDDSGDESFEIDFDTDSDKSTNKLTSAALLIGALSDKDRVVALQQVSKHIQSDESVNDIKIKLKNVQRDKETQRNLQQPNNNSSMLDNYDKRIGELTNDLNQAINTNNSFANTVGVVQLISKNTNGVKYDQGELDAYTSKLSKENENLKKILETYKNNRVVSYGIIDDLVVTADNNNNALIKTNEALQITLNEYIKKEKRVNLDSKKVNEKPVISTTDITDLLGKSGYSYNTISGLTSSSDGCGDVCDTIISALLSLNELQRAAMDEFNKTLSEKTTKNSSLENDVTRLSQDLETNKKALLAGRADILDKKTEKKNMGEKLKKMEKNIQELENYKSLNNTRSILHNSVISDMENKHKNDLEEARRQPLKNAEVASELEQLKSNYKKLQDENTRLSIDPINSQIDELKELLENKTINYDSSTSRLNDIITNLTDKLDKQNKLIEDYDRMLESIGLTNEEHTNDITKLKDQVQILKTENTILLNELTNLREKHKKSMEKHKKSMESLMFTEDEIIDGKFKKTQRGTRANEDIMADGDVDAFLEKNISNLSNETGGILGGGYSDDVMNFGGIVGVGGGMLFSENAVTLLMVTCVILLMYLIHIMYYQPESCGYKKKNSCDRVPRNKVIKFAKC
jgi:hypothetical protein